MNWHKLDSKNNRFHFSKANKDSHTIYDDETVYHKRIYYMLSFQYEFEFNDDEVYFSYSLPYTFSMCLNYTKIIAAA